MFVIKYQYVRVIILDFSVHFPVPVFNISIAHAFISLIPRISIKVAVSTTICSDSAALFIARPFASDEFVSV